MLFRRIAALSFSFVVSVSALFPSSPAGAQITIANDKIPQVIWELVPDPDHQERVFLDGAGPNGSKWQGGFLISSRDGQPITFRRQIGEGRHRIEFDNKRTEYISWVSSCIEGPAERLPLDERARDAELRFLECDHPNQFELVTHQAWWFPPGTKRKV